MFFIAGAGEEAKVIGQGEFSCPRCDQLRSYVQMRISGYVSAFFVPVWQSSGGSEFVECQSCGSQFDNSVLVADFDRIREIIRLTKVAEESGRNALESRDPKIARSHYDVAIEAYRLALALRPDSELHEDIARTMGVLKEWFPSTLCMNEALGICDKANNRPVNEQLKLLRKAKERLEDGLSRRDIGYDGIMSIYEQVVSVVQEAEALSRKQGR